MEHPMTTVPYHIDHEGREYALSYVHETETAAREDCASRSEQAIIRPIDLDTQYHGVYTASPIDVTATEAVDLDSYGTDDAYLLDSVFSIFGVIDDQQDLTWYKPLEPDALVSAFNRVEWRHSVPAVGSQLLSNLILAHGLPNANHRTALAFVDAYLATIESSFDPPATTTSTNEWCPWVDDYIVDSKRLLTLTTNARLFNWLAEHGVTVIQRKDGIDIPLDEYQLAVDDPWERFSGSHQRRSRAFVAEYIRQSGFESLLDRQDDGKEAFVRRL